MLALFPNNSYVSSLLLHKIIMKAACTTDFNLLLPFLIHVQGKALELLYCSVLQYNDCVSPLHQCKQNAQVRREQILHCCILKERE